MIKENIFAILASVRRPLEKAGYDADEIVQLSDGLSTDKIARKQ